MPQGPVKSSTSNGVKKVVTNMERKYNTNNEKKNGPNTEKKNNGSVKNTTTTTPSTPVEEKPKFNLELDSKVPTPIEAVVSTLPGTNDTTPEMEKKEIQETQIEVKPQPQVQSPPPTKPAEQERKPEEPHTVPKEIKERKDVDVVPEPTVTLVRTTTAPALELAQPDVIPTILSKGEQEISKSISEGPSEEDQDENPGGPKGETLASVESVRSNSSVETVRAAAKAVGRDKPEAEVEVLSANNLMKSDGHNRSVAWDK